MQQHHSNEFKSVENHELKVADIKKNCIKIKRKTNAFRCSEDEGSQGGAQHGTYN